MKTSSSSSVYWVGTSRVEDRQVIAFAVLRGRGGGDARACWRMLPIASHSTLRSPSLQRYGRATYVCIGALRVQGLYVRCVTRGMKLLERFMRQISTAAPLSSEAKRAKTRAPGNTCARGDVPVLRYNSASEGRAGIYMGNSVARQQAIGLVAAAFRPCIRKSGLGKSGPIRRASNQYSMGARRVQLNGLQAIRHPTLCRVLRRTHECS